jgi:hypothetical protein
MVNVCFSQNSNPGSLERFVLKLSLLTMWALVIFVFSNNAFEVSFVLIKFNLFFVLILRFPMERAQVIRSSAKSLFQSEFEHGFSRICS